jgi:hypothetical protein
MNRALILGITGLLLSATGCSDDTTPPGVDSFVQLDTIVDDAAFDAPVADISLDAGNDVAADTALTDAVADAAADAAPTDVSVPDAALPDGPVGDLGAPSIWGYVTRSVAPVLDGKGNLFVALYNPFFPPPAFPSATTTLYKADLSKSGTKLKYEIHNAPLGAHNLWAFLDDNNNIMPPFPAPDAVDLVMAKLISVTIVKGTTIKQDVVLSKLEGGTTSLAGLKGIVSAKIAPSGDGKGTLFIFLHDKKPPSAQLVNTPVNGADLSSPFASEQYYIGGVAAGQYYVTAFLDDNNNANPLFFPQADKGDMIMSNATQVHVLAGTIHAHNIVLDAIK